MNILAAFGIAADINELLEHVVAHSLEKEQEPDPVEISIGHRLAGEEGTLGVLLQQARDIPDVLDRIVPQDLSALLLGGQLREGLPDDVGAGADPVLGAGRVQDAGRDPVQDDAEEALAEAVVDQGRDLLDDLGNVRRVEVDARLRVFLLQVLGNVLGVHHVLAIWKFDGGDRVEVHALGESDAVKVISIFLLLLRFPALESRDWLLIVLTALQTLA